MAKSVLKSTRRKHDTKEMTKSKLWYGNNFIEEYMNVEKYSTLDIPHDPEALSWTWDN